MPPNTNLKKISWKDDFYQPNKAKIRITSKRLENGQKSNEKENHTTNKIKKALEMAEWNCRARVSNAP